LRQAREGREQQGQQEQVMAARHGGSRSHSGGSA
jgi:hypothetical protein